MRECGWKKKSSFIPLLKRWGFLNSAALYNLISMTGNKIVEQIYSEEGVWVSHKMFLSHLMTTTKASKLNPYFDVSSKSCTLTCTPPKLTRKNRQKEEEGASSLFQTIKTIRSYFLNNTFEKGFLGFWCSERSVPCLVRGAICSFKSFWVICLANTFTELKSGTCFGKRYCSSFVEKKILI